MKTFHWFKRKCDIVGGGDLNGTFKMILYYDPEIQLYWLYSSVETNNVSIRKTHKLKIKLKQLNHKPYNLFIQRILST